MSYHRKNKDHDRAALGDAASVLQTVATGVSVVNDPYFNEAVCRIGQLRSIENGQPVGACAKTPPNLGGGVGLRKAMPAMRAYVVAEQHRPWSYVAGAAVVLGIPMLIGYALGRKG